MSQVRSGCVAGAERLVAGAERLVAGAERLVAGAERLVDSCSACIFGTLQAQLQEGGPSMFSLRHATGTQKMVMTALMMCLTLVSTVMFRIPVPMTQGYVHLGDAMIFIGIAVLGRHYGTVAAALGSAMADVLGGFAFWAPWTLVIKLAMAYLTGTLLLRHGNGKMQEILAMAAGGSVMCLGYLIAERVMYGTWAAALLGLPWNIGQATVGIVVSIIVTSHLASTERDN